tara:strand:- start:297 stop:581 length:285 start_codon:yes stop_codon:yes gene_type:complete
MTTIHEEDFPFEEIRDEGGDYFYRISELLALGYVESQIWSVVSGDDEVDQNGQRWIYFTYGPSHHYVNLIGYVATKEHHDGDTYYEEAMDMDPL